MKRLKFGNKKLNIKSETLHKLIECSLACPNLTRSCLSKRISVSQVTAGKLLSALDECGFTDLCYATESGASYPSKNHIFRKDVSVLVLDFSSFKYTATIVFGKCHKATAFDYFPDPTLSFESNATVFISKVGKSISQLPYCVSAICSIVADDPNTVLKNASTPAASLPSKQEIEAVNRLCVQFFSIMPVFCITLSQAVGSAAKFGVIELTDADKNAAYIRISDSLDAVYLPRKSSPEPIALHKLMFNRLPLSRALEEADTYDKMANAVSSVINLIDCAFNSPKITVEFSKERFGDLEKHISIVFKSASLPLPDVEYYNLEPQSPIMGAAMAALAEIISTQISGI